MENGNLSHKIVFPVYIERDEQYGFTELHYLGRTSYLPDRPITQSEMNEELNYIEQELMLLN
jgi:hypothetical protein